MKHAVLILIALFLLVLLPTGRYIPVGGSSEAREIHVARSIQETGDWITPDRNGIAPSKPPLYHWVCAAISRILAHPVTPTITRGVNVLAALVIILLMWWIGTTQKVFNSVHHHVLYALILCSSHIFINASVDSKVDMFAACWITASLAAFLSNRKFAFTTLLGLSILSKGPICGALIGLGMISLGDIRKESLRKFILSWAPCVIVGGLIGSAWYGALWFHGNGVTLERQMLFENYRRFFGGEGIISKPWWYYLQGVLIGALPWSIFFFGFLFSPYTKNRFAISARNFFIAGVVLFSFSEGKRVSYLVPLFPWFALFLTSSLTEWWMRITDKTHGRFIDLARSFILLSSLIFLLLIPSLQLLTLFHPQSPTIHIARAWLMINNVNLAFILIGGLSCLFFTREKILLSLLVTITTAWSFINATSEGVKAALRDFERAAVSIAEHVPSKQLSVVKIPSDELLDPIMYYLPFPVTISQTIPAQGMILLRETYADSLRSSCKTIDRYLQIPDQEHLKSERAIILQGCSEIRTDEVPQIKQ